MMSVAVGDQVVDRLRRRFPLISAQEVEQCVSDLRLCCTHLGYACNDECGDELVERLAATRLAERQMGDRHAPRLRSGCAPLSHC